MAFLYVGCWFLIAGVVYCFLGFAKPAFGED
jgi:hypothetical protein